MRRPRISLRRRAHETRWTDVTAGLRQRLVVRLGTGPVVEHFAELASIGMAACTPPSVFVEFLLSLDKPAATSMWGAQLSSGKRPSHPLSQSAALCSSLRSRNASSAI